MNSTRDIIQQVQWFVCGSVRSQLEYSMNQRNIMVNKWAICRLKINA